MAVIVDSPGTVDLLSTTERNKSPAANGFISSFISTPGELLSINLLKTTALGTLAFFSSAAERELLAQDRSFGLVADILSAAPPLETRPEIRFGDRHAERLSPEGFASALRDRDKYPGVSCGKISAPKSEAGAQIEHRDGSYFKLKGAIPEVIRFNRGEFVRLGDSFGDSKLIIDEVKSIRPYPLSAYTLAWEELVSNPPEAGDLLVIRRPNGHLDYRSGVVKELGAETVKFLLEEEPYLVPLERIEGVILNGSKSQTLPPIASDKAERILVLQDARIRCVDCELIEGPSPRLRVTLTSGSTIDCEVQPFYLDSTKIVAKTFEQLSPRILSYEPFLSATESNLESDNSAGRELEGLLFEVPARPYAILESSLSPVPRGLVLNGAMSVTLEIPAGYSQLYIAPSFKGLAQNTISIVSDGREVYSRSRYKKRDAARDRIGGGELTDLPTADDLILTPIGPDVVQIRDGQPITLHISNVGEVHFTTFLLARSRE